LCRHTTPARKLPDNRRRARATKTNIHVRHWLQRTRSRIANILSLGASTGAIILFARRNFTAGSTAGTKPGSWRGCSTLIILQSAALGQCYCFVTACNPALPAGITAPVNRSNLTIISIENHLIATITEPPSVQILHFMVTTRTNANLVPVPTQPLLRQCDIAALSISTDNPSIGPLGGRWARGTNQQRGQDQNNRQPHKLLRFETVKKSLRNGHQVKCRRWSSVQISSVRCSKVTVVT